MKDEKNERDTVNATINTTASATVDAAVKSITTDRPPTADIEAAGKRVHASLFLNQAIVGDQATADEVQVTDRQLDSIDHYITAIPDYLAGRLTPAQRILFEEESRQSIPLRRALNAARRIPEHPVTHEPKSPRAPLLRWFAAAAAVAAITLTLFSILPEMPSFDQSRLAQVGEINGSLYHVSDGRLSLLAPGAWIDGQQVLRTGKDTTAILILDDQSQVEIDSRSELSVTRRNSGNRIDITRGRIMVAASKQGSGTLAVTTDEFIVSVTGTIFEVGHGAKGSRVSVIEGEVQVYHHGNSTSLTQGEQMGSRTGLLYLDIGEEIAWSRDADQYIEMLENASALQRDLERVMSTEPRFSTRLLDLSPEDTVVYIAVPNAPEKITDVYQLFRSRMQASEDLNLVWENVETENQGQHLDQIMSWLSEIGDNLGDETVVTLSVQSSGEEQQIIPVVLSEVDSDAFVSTFDAQIQKLHETWSATGEEKTLKIILIDDPADAVSGQLSIWLHGDLMVATISPEAMRQMQTIVENGSSAFVGSDFHSRLLTAYDMGAEFLGAIHIARVLPESSTAQHKLKLIGLHNAEFLFTERRQQGGHAVLSAELQFSGKRSGVMSWLSAPGPMGSLEFFSANATIATAFVVKDPSVIIDELEQMASRLHADPVEESPMEPVESDHQIGVFGLELRNELIPALGGEVALGLDGPALPTPALKIVIEVYDELRLQQGIERMVEQINQRATADGDVTLVISTADVGNYTGYRLSISIEPGSTTQQLPILTSINYAYVDGYLVAAPTRALVEKAINQYKSGAGLLTDEEFRSLLPLDGLLNFSAVSFNRMADLVEDLLAYMPTDLSKEQQETVKQLTSETGASMISVYAMQDRIRVVQKGDTNLPLSLSRLSSLRSFADTLTTSH